MYLFRCLKIALFENANVPRAVGIIDVPLYLKSTRISYYRTNEIIMNEEAELRV